MATRKAIDWEAVEIQYRAGIRSLKDIGSEFGVSDAGILKRVKRDGWTRDLKGKIQSKADAKVSEALVSAEVSAETRVTEKLTIEVEATIQARIRLLHRKDVGRSRKVVMSLLDELELACGPENAVLIAELGEVMRSEDRNGQDKRNDLYNKLMGLSGRAKTMKDLGDSLKTLIGLEREAHGINSDQGTGGNQAPAGLAHFYGEST